MHSRFECWIPGPPRTKNSRKAVVGKDGKARVRADPKGKRRQGAMAKLLHLRYGGRDPITGPVELVVEFVFEAPKTPKWVRVLALEGLYHKITKPDLSRCVTLVEDAITEARIWGDDNQVVQISASKSYGPSPGTLVRIHPLRQPTRESAKEMGRGYSYPRQLVG